MIPIRESVPSRRVPIVTYLLIGAAVLVFVFELTLSERALERFVREWGVTPRLVLGAVVGDPRVPRVALLTLFTSQFIHAGFVHLGGNMLFLWVFGRAIEDRFGHVVFLLFYVVAGALAAIAQSLVVGAASAVPLVGASGAIAGVLGAYFISFPGAWVTVLLPVLFFFWAFDLPAVLVLAFWFVSQFFNGIATITAATGATASGVAFWAHVAGFVAGAITAPFMPNHAAKGALGARARAPHRADVPGPARLIGSVANLLALLLGARTVLHFLTVGPRPPLPFLSLPIFAVTQPLVRPFAEVIPAVRVEGRVLEVYTLVAILVIYIIAGVLGRLVPGGEHQGGGRANHA